jgi:hypothetical protein
VAETLWEGGNKMAKSFLNAGEPFITEMLQVPNAKLAIY